MRWLMLDMALAVMASLTHLKDMTGSASVDADRTSRG
jgi:hypothetical protein